MEIDAHDVLERYLASNQNGVDPLDNPEVHKALYELVYKMNYSWTQFAKNDLLEKLVDPNAELNILERVLLERLLDEELGGPTNSTASS